MRTWISEARGSVLLTASTASEKSNPGGIPAFQRSMDSWSRSMKSHLYRAIAIAAMIATPAMAQTTTRTSNTMSTPAPGVGASTPTLSHDGSNSLTTPNAAAQTTTRTSNTMSTPAPARCRGERADVIS
jgi:hypothetical protein